jgi:hypothetical protein
VTASIFTPLLFAEHIMQNANHGDRGRRPLPCFRATGRGGRAASLATKPGRVYHNHLRTPPSCITTTPSHRRASHYGRTGKHRGRCKKKITPSLAPSSMRTAGDHSPAATSRQRPSGAAREERLSVRDHLLGRLENTRSRCTT